MAELTLNEKRLLAALAKEKKADAEHLASLLDATPEAVVQWAHLAEDKGLAKVERIVEKQILPTEEGEQYRKFNLPETQLFALIRPGTQLADLQKHPAFKIGFGQLRKKGLIRVEGSAVLKNENMSTAAEESALRNPVSGESHTKKLIKRGILAESETVRYAISIIPEGLALVHQGLDLREEIGTLTRDQILSGSWKTASLRRYDVKKLPKTVYPGKSHPYQRLIDEMRQILLEMGFTEMHGEIVQSAFWNFDALFQPQDHPAREMQDTFYLKEEVSLPDGWECLRDMHEHGGNTSSTGWGGKWNPGKAKQCVLRTHTTSLSIQYLAAHPEPPVKAFCIGRVYRREAIDPTHTPEFEQLEGIVMDKDVTFRHLLGFLKEFYQRMGFSDVRFRPGFFPYTEPSVEPEIWVDGLGWVEMGGAGVFRQEVTDPWGVECPVLAWGLGVSRVAMLRLGLKDLRQLYQSDLEWIRNSPVHAPGAAGRKA
ncbi:phenylalanine--tRNA ligase subunit alpha [Methanoregula sp.]|uniref:phenylalanine--tRNA ligase subunit alpha n=1 Tax=Methanoregula sp. TaxID=2052170 RepID=UPI003BB1D639